MRFFKIFLNFFFSLSFLILFYEVGLSTSDKGYGNLEADENLKTPDLRRWEERSFPDIKSRYEFIADFTIMPAERPISTENFWRYPIALPLRSFPLDYSLGNGPGELPATTGNSLAIRHMNEGRMLIKEGKFDAARHVLLSARSRFGDNFPEHRRNDYLTAISFLRLAELEGRRQNFVWGNHSVRLHYSNLATFLHWSFVKKQNVKDALLDPITPKALVLLASLYMTFQEYDSALHAASTGLHFLQENGKTDYKTNFYEILAETSIRRRDYYEAVRYLDRNIRFTEDPIIASRQFHRVAEIYFDLNQYDIAEDIFRIAQAIDKITGHVNPMSYFLRGECLFWTKRFREAEEMIRYALYTNNMPTSEKKMENYHLSWAQLRLADTLLAQYSEQDPSEKVSSDLLHKTKVAYFKVETEYGKNDVTGIAKVRRLCLELPDYQGNNVKHARTSLEEISKEDYPYEALEIAKKCKVLSYAKRDTKMEFLQEASDFYKLFPKSKHIVDYIQPLTSMRQEQLDIFLSKEETYASAIAYYEKNKNSFLSELSETQRRNLFLAYATKDEYKSAYPFYPYFLKGISSASAEQLLLFAAFAADSLESDTISSKEDEQTKLKSQAENISELLQARISLLKNNKISLNQLIKIAHSSLRKKFTPYLLNQFESWSTKDASLFCSLYYPILSKSFEDLDSDKPSISKEEAWNRIQKQLQTWMPQLFDLIPSCAQNLLSLENTIGKSYEYFPTMVEQWNQRLQWPRRDLYLPIQWQIASQAYLNNVHKETAKKIIQDIAKIKETTSKEVTFAQILLDESKTETQSLWGD